MAAFYSCFINCKRWTGMLLVWKQAEPCWALKVYYVCELFAQWLFGDCKRPSKRQRETNTSVLHHHWCWSRLQVRASTVQSLVVLSLHEWHTLYYKCTSVWSSISTLQSSLQSSPNECRVFGGKKVDWLSDMLSLYYNILQCCCK